MQEGKEITGFRSTRERFWTVEALNLPWDDTQTTVGLQTEKRNIATEIMQGSPLTQNTKPSQLKRHETYQLILRYL